MGGAILLIVIDSLVVTFELGGDNKTFFVGDIDRKRHEHPPDRRMALLDGQFDIVRIKVAAGDDDEILETAGDEQFAIFQESQVAGAE